MVCFGPRCPRGPFAIYKMRAEKKAYHYDEETKRHPVYHHRGTLLLQLQPVCEAGRGAPVGAEGPVQLCGLCHWDHRYDVPGTCLLSLAEGQFRADAGAGPVGRGGGAVSLLRHRTHESGGRHDPQQIVSLLCDPVLLDVPERGDDGGTYCLYGGGVFWQPTDRQTGFCHHGGLARIHGFSGRGHHRGILCGGAGAGGGSFPPRW